MAEAGRFYHEAAGAITDRPEAERAEVHEQLGPPFVHVWVAFLRSLAATKGLAPEHVSTVKTYWEGNVVKSSPVQLPAHVRHCRAKPCRKMEARKGGCASCSASILLWLQCERNRTCIWSSTSDMSQIEGGHPGNFLLMWCQELSGDCQSAHKLVNTVQLVIGLCFNSTMRTLDTMRRGGLY